MFITVTVTFQNSFQVVLHHYTCWSSLQPVSKSRQVLHSITDFERCVTVWCGLEICSSFESNHAAFHPSRELRRGFAFSKNEVVINTLSLSVQRWAKGGRGGVIPRVDEFTCKKLTLQLQWRNFTTPNNNALWGAPISVAIADVYHLQAMTAFDMTHRGWVPEAGCMGSWLVPTQQQLVQPTTGYTLFQGGNPWGCRWLENVTQVEMTYTGNWQHCYICIYIYICSVHGGPSTKTSYPEDP